MGWRFRKSIKIFPGIRLNFGRKGFTSATIGKGWTSTNLSSKGVHQNFNVPGTGISYRMKLTPGESPSNAIEPTRWTCGRCDGPNIGNGVFCAYCGLQRGNPSQTDPYLPPKNNTVRDSWLLLGGIVGGLLTICVIGTIIGNLSRPASVANTSGPARTPTPSPRPTATPAPLLAKGKTPKTKKTPSATPTPGVIETNVGADADDSASGSSPPSLYSQPRSAPTSPRALAPAGRFSSGGRVYITGPRGGCYYINGNGNKTYVDHSYCR